MVHIANLCFYYLILFNEYKKNDCFSIGASQDKRKFAVPTGTKTMW
jgi:hypothetical protein